MAEERVDPKVVVEKRALVGEGVLWNNHKKVCYWVDILSNEVYIYDPATDTNRTIHTCQPVGTVVPRALGGLTVALHNGFANIDLETEKMTPIGKDPEWDIPANRFNDGKCDPAGRLWAGTMEFGGATGEGSLYCLDADHSVSKKVENVSISNGIVWSHDSETMYFVDSLAMNVRAYDYDIDTGNIGNERVVVKNEGEGIFDGMAIDEDGLLWIAVFGGWGVRVYNPDSGELVRDIRLPVEQVTACAFGGDDLNELYITSAAYLLDEQRLAQQPLAGSLIKIDPGTSGVPSYNYAG